MFFWIYNDGHNINIEIRLIIEFFHYLLFGNLHATLCRTQQVIGGQSEEITDELLLKANDIQFLGSLLRFPVVTKEYLD